VRVEARKGLDVLNRPPCHAEEEDEEMRRFALLVAVLVFGALLAGCTGRALGPGEGRLSASGRAQVATPGHNWTSVRGTRTLHAGDRVRVLQGDAKIDLSKGRTLELRQGSSVQLQQVPSLLTGDLLATARETPLRVSAAGTQGTVAQGAAHVSRSLAVVVASYSGTIHVDSAGRQIDVPALRQAGVPAPGLIPVKPVPLAYDVHNPWDRRFLGDAIELGDELAARSQGFTAQLAPDEGHTAGFYRQLVPDLDKERSFDQSLVDPAAAPGETLVGAAIAVASRRGGFVQRWQSVFEFRTAGARWGLVALDQRVSRAPLLSNIDEALGRASTTIRPTTQLAAPAAPLALTPSVPETAPVTPTSAGAPPRQPNGPTGGKTPSTTQPPPTGLLPLPTPPTTAPPPNQPGPVGGLLGGVTNAVGDLLGGLLSPRR
jgi:hypothetical protein